MSNWTGAPNLTCDDHLRCALLRQTQYVDRKWERVVETAHRLLGTAAIILLIDEKHGQVAASHGMQVDTILRRTSFCAWSFVPVCPEVLMVPDATKDPRFCENPIVTGAPFVRFYAGAPLLHGGHRLGSLCCIDTVPKSFSAEALAVLCNLASLCTQADGMAICEMKHEMLHVMCANSNFKHGEVLSMNDDNVQCVPVCTPYTAHQISFVDHDQCASTSFENYFLVHTNTDRILQDKSELVKQMKRVNLHIGPLIGKGLHGLIFEGQHHADHVAVKTMHMIPGVSSSLINNRIHIEPHRNVAKLARFYMTAQSVGVVVMQRCNGSLSQYIEKGTFRTRCSFFNGSVDLAPVLSIAMQIAEGMEHLHRQGVTHGNLHASNILLRSNDVPLITDYVGLELLSTAHADATYSVTHSAPEVLQEGLVTSAADVYSFGVLFWEMITGRRAFAGLQHDAVLTLKSQDTAVLTCDVYFPSGISSLVSDCVDSDMSHRPSFSNIISRLKSDLIEIVPDFCVYGTS